MSLPTLKKLGKGPTRFGVPQKPIDVQLASSAGPNEREVGWIQNGWPQQISAKTTRHSPPTASDALLTTYICHGQSPVEPATPHSPAVETMPCHGIGRARHGRAGTCLGFGFGHERPMLAFEACERPNAAPADTPPHPSGFPRDGADRRPTTPNPFGPLAPSRGRQRPRHVLWPTNATPRTSNP